MNCVPIQDNDLTSLRTTTKRDSHGSRRLLGKDDDGDRCSVECCREEMMMGTTKIQQEACGVSSMAEILPVSFLMSSASQMSMPIVDVEDRSMFPIVVRYG